MKNSKKITSVIISFIFGTLAFSQTFYVAVKTANVKAKDSNSSKTVASVSYGDAVTVVDEGTKWTQVKLSNGTTGWLNSSSLSKRKIVASSKVSTDAKEIALAGKGFGDGISAESDSKGNYSAVDAVEKNSVTEKENTAFKTNGGLKVAD